MRNLQKVRFQGNKGYIYFNKDGDHPGMIKIQRLQGKYHQFNKATLLNIRGGTVANSLAKLGPTKLYLLFAFSAKV